MQSSKLTIALAAASLAVAGTAHAGGLGSGKGTPDAAPAPGAATAKPGDQPSFGAAALSKVGGYAVVNSGALIAPAGAQVHGEAHCPAGTVVFGGGTTVASWSTAANINDSYPTTLGWSVDVNNASGTDTAFSVHAVCGTQPRRYQRLTVKTPFGVRWLMNVRQPSTV